VRHPHKLRTGQLSANRFALVIRELGEDEISRAEDRLAGLVSLGMPNRFGEQRFGRTGDNAELGLRALRGERVRADRRQLRFLVSALQSAVFNEALRARVLPLHRLEAGDVAVVHASGGPFRVDAPDVEQPRADAFEISPTGPIFGSRALEPGGAPLERERAALAACGIDPDAPLRPPPGLRLRGGRRPLRVRPEEATLERVDAGALRLRVRLPAGSFATVLLEEIFGGGPAGPAIR
jgi:tRNA pseudouridine13 synthase